MIRLGAPEALTPDIAPEHAAMLDAPTVDDLSGDCREQTQRYLRGEPSLDDSCLELFRRAIVGRSEEAWAAVYHQYAAFVRRWLGTSMDPDEAVSLAFERFWHALDQEKFARFASLAAVLSYLKMCVRTVAIDHARSSQIQAATAQTDAADIVPAADDVERDVVDRLDAAALWKRINEALDDDRATRVLYLSYVVDLSPREISTRYPALCEDVNAVYQVKRNALDRLRRAGILSSWQQ
jgi:RNA polymerase sigma factor (sigma-70 family)